MSESLLPVMSRRRVLEAAAKVTGLGAALALLPLREDRAQDAKAFPGFKYALCNEMFLDWPFDKTFAFIAECGYTGVEIAPFTVAPDVTTVSASRRTEIRRQAERANLEILGLHWLLAKTTGLYLTSPDAEVRRRTSTYFGELAQFCADLGGKIMVLGSPKQRDLLPGVTPEQAMQFAAATLSEAMPMLEKAGVVLALEPLGPNETTFLLTAADGVELMKRVNSPGCRLHLDCKAMATESMPVADIIRKFRAECVHFHANDPNYQGPGFGKLDFVPIMKALREIDYRGWVSVEPIDYAPGVERLARESIQYLRKCEPKA